MKTYILLKDDKKIGKEVGDYYNNEYSESINELIEKGIIEEEIIEEMPLFKGTREELDNLTIF